MPVKKQAALKNETVWRVQNEFGDGPYRGMGNVRGILRAFENAGRLPGLEEGRRPVPWRDKTIREKFNYKAGMNENSVCGFRTIEQYHRWFSTQEVRDLLHCAGFFLAKFEVAGPVCHGQTQSLFFPEQAKLVAVRACNGSGAMPAENAKLKSAQRFVNAQKSGQLNIKFPCV